MKLKSEVVREERKAGGEGTTVIEKRLAKEQLRDRCGMFSRVTLNPGCSIGVHTHHGNTETYYILSGEGTYTDDGETYPVRPGDITFCPEGHSHGLACAGSEPLIFMALIINT